MVADTETQLSVSSSRLRVRIEALGARITSILHLPTAIELLASEESTQATSAARLTEAGWQRRFASGWNVLIPNAGDARTVDGVTHDYHGEAARRVWRLSGSAHTATAAVTLRSVPLTLTRTVSVTDLALTVHQEIRNDSDERQQIAWVEHPVFEGAHFAAGGSVSLDGVAVPHAPRGHGRFDSARVPSGRVSSEVADHPLALTLAWDPRVLPHMHVWQERQSVTGAPWFGRIDAVGLEPASHGPGNPESGLGPLVLDAQCVLESSLRLELHDRG